MESLWQIIVETVKTLKLASNIQKINDIQRVHRINIFGERVWLPVLPGASLIFLDKLQPEN